MKPTLASLDYSQMYRLRDPLSSRFIRLGSLDDELLTHEETHGLARGQLKPQTPIRLVSAQGSKLADILWSGYVEIFCVSERVIHLLTQGQISGWSTYPVELHDSNGDVMSGYRGFAVTGGECERDRSRSSVVAKPAPSPKGKAHDVYKGLYFQENQWDGSDMFWIRNRGIVVTENVYQILKEAHVTNVELIALKNVEIRVDLDKYER